jgi:hypothetical protein
MCVALPMAISNPKGANSFSIKVHITLPLFFGLSPLTSIPNLNSGIMAFSIT